MPTVTMVEYDNAPGDVFADVAASLAVLKDGGFVYDDHRFIERNVAIRSLGNTLDFVLDPRTISEESWEGIYRPLRTLSFAVDHAL